VAKKKVSKKPKKTVTPKVKKTKPVYWYVAVKDSTSGQIEISRFTSPQVAAEFAREMEHSCLEILCGWGE
jgi:hypothetical protein